MGFYAVLSFKMVCNILRLGAVFDIDNFSFDTNILTYGVICWNRRFRVSTFGKL